MTSANGYTSRNWRIKMFKVGDKVRLVRRGIPTKEECGRRWDRDWPEWAGLEIGDICTVTAVDEDDTFQISTLKVDDGSLWFDPWYFKKVEGVTKPLNYEGCHPDIAKALKSGNVVKCKVWDDKCGNEHVAWVIAYYDGVYHTSSTYHDRAEPFSPKYRVKSPRAILRALEKGGYEWDNGSWMWRSETNSVMFRPEMFAYCGKKVEYRSGKWRVDSWVFIEDWLEEVE
jgi:hypothetical protein